LRRVRRIFVSQRDLAAHAPFGWRPDHPWIL
jgi:hypothetical protein